MQDDLRNIITHRLPVLLNRGAIKLVIIDSIAALFRVEYSLGETSKRAKVLRSFGAQLHKLSNLYSIPVVCVNQVCVHHTGLSDTFLLINILWTLGQNYEVFKCW